MEKRGEKLLKLDCVWEEVIFIDIENMGSWKKVEVLKYKAATMEPEKEIFSFKHGFGEENVPLKNRLYEQLKRENIHWIWQKYLISPPLFSIELYNYIKLEGKRESVNKRIDHKALSSYELLLRNEELWSSEGFKYVYRPEQENISKKIRENFQKGERIFIEAPTGQLQYAHMKIQGIKTKKVVILLFLQIQKNYKINL